MGTMEALLNKIADLRLLVIGDVMLDRYICGDATRISPEAPVPVVAVDHEKQSLGAAANVALNVASLGAHVELVGAVGHDRYGEMLKQLLKKNKIHYEDTFSSPSLHTITKTRVVVRGQQLCRIDYEESRAHYQLSPEQVQAICQKIQHVHAVILSDYAKGVITQDNVQLFIDTAREHNVFIAMDPKPIHHLKFHDVHLMTPNKTEAIQMCDGVIDEPDIALEEVVEKLNHQFRPEHIVVTLGKEGMWVADKKKQLQIPTYAQEVFDVSGAGDTSIACLTLAMAAKESLIRSAKFANIAAGIVVARHGTVAITKEALLKTEWASRYFEL